MAGWNGNGNGTDDYGFSALPGGDRNGNQFHYRHVGNIGRWWSENVGSSSSASHWSTNYDNDRMYAESQLKTYGFSARCVKR